MIFLCLDIVYDLFSLRLDFSLLYTKKGNGIGWFQQCTLVFKRRNGEDWWRLPMIPFILFNV